MITFNENQKKFMKENGINDDFENLKDDDFVLIEETVGTIIQVKGFDSNYEVTDTGIMCESILDLM